MGDREEVSSLSHRSLLTYTPCCFPFFSRILPLSARPHSDFHTCHPEGDGSDENSDPMGVQQLPPSSSQQLPPSSAQRANPPTAGKRKRAGVGSTAEGSTVAAVEMEFPYYPGGHPPLLPLAEDSALLDFGALLDACQQQQGFDVSALLAAWQQGQQQQVQEDSEGGGRKRARLGRGGSGGRGRRGRQPPALSGQPPALSGQLPAMWGGQEDGAPGSGEGPLALPPWLCAAMAQVAPSSRQAGNVLQVQQQQTGDVLQRQVQQVPEPQEGGQFVEDRLPPDSDDEDFDDREKSTAAEAPPTLRGGERRRGRGGEATLPRPSGRDGPLPRQGAAGTTGTSGQQQQGLPRGRIADGGSGGGSWSEADDRVVLKTLLQMVGGSIDLRGREEGDADTHRFCALSSP